MPTGYTADVGDGKVTEFREFAMQCARAFGALITMRDDPADAEIPDEFPVDDYPMRMLTEERKRLAELRAMDDNEADRQASAAYKNALAYYHERQREQATIRARYEAMLDQVRAWEPPTADHVEMKNFMVQQLEESIRFDTSYELPVVTPQTGAEWRAEEIERNERMAARHAEDHEKAVERAAGRTTWVKALRDSLGQPAHNDIRVRS